MHNISLYSLLGSPINHSLSPTIHNAAFKEKNINAIYLPFNINKKSLEDAIKSIKTLGISGGNITFPLKTAFIKHADNLSQISSITGAANTFTYKNGKISCYNTDGMGFIQSLEEKNIDYKNMNILLIGIGGAGNSIATSLAINNVKKIFIKGKTIEKPLILKEKLEKHLDFYNIEIVEDEKKLKNIIQDIDLIINSSNTGMNEDISPIDDDIIFKKNSFVYDIIYSPMKTRLIKNAEKQGIKTLNGISMLIHQANQAFKIWTNKNFDIEKMEARIEKILK